MATNYVQPGNVLDLVAPSGGFTTSTGYLVGSIFGVAMTTVLQSATGEIAVTGVWTLPKATGAWTAGDLVYWDDSAKNVTKTSSANTKIGVAVADKLSGDTTGKVRLNGSF